MGAWHGACVSTWRRVAAGWVAPRLEFATRVASTWYLPHSHVEHQYHQQNHHHHHHHHQTEMQHLYELA